MKFMKFSDFVQLKESIKDVADSIGEKAIIKQRSRERKLGLSPHGDTAKFLKSKGLRIDGSENKSSE